MNEDEQDTGGTTADDMGGATGITGGGESGGPGEGVKSRDTSTGESQGAGAADLNAGQPSIQDDQPDADAGRNATSGSEETGLA
jgi:hypothetical protein